jgi:hypothetical protein
VTFLLFRVLWPSLSQIKNPMNTILYIWVGSEFCYFVEHSIVAKYEIHYVRHRNLFNSCIFPGCESSMFYSVEQVATFVLELYSAIIISHFVFNPVFYVQGKTVKLSSFSFLSHPLPSYLSSISPIELTFVHTRLNVCHDGCEMNSACNVQNVCSSCVACSTVGASFVLPFLRYKDSNTWETNLKSFWFWTLNLLDSGVFTLEGLFI